MAEARLSGHSHRRCCSQLLLHLQVSWEAEWRHAACSWNRRHGKLAHHPCRNGCASRRVLRLLAEWVCVAASTKGSLPCATPKLCLPCRPTRRLLACVPTEATACRLLLQVEQVCDLPGAQHTGHRGRARTAVGRAAAGGHAPGATPTGGQKRSLHRKCAGAGHGTWCGRAGGDCCHLLLQTCYAQLVGSRLVLKQLTPAWPGGLHSSSQQLTTCAEVCPVQKPKVEPKAVKAMSEPHTKRL